MLKQALRARSLTLLIGMAIGVVAAIVLGSVLLSDRPATAHLDPWAPGHVLSYSYSNSSCSNKKDPIQVVYYRTATTSKVNTHSGHHGWSVNPNSSTQYFYDHGCSGHDGERANGSYSRYHQRYETANASDSYWGTYSLATPHYEDYVWPECGYFGGKHAVRENNSSSMPEGGFINAKHEVDRKWTYNWSGGGATGNHYWWGTQDWDNVDWMRQCDGEYAWGNGIVDFIEIP